MSERDDVLLTSVTSDHEALREALAPYAFGTLDASAAAMVETHLAGCPECTAAVADYQAVVRALPLVLPLSQPPAGARERLLARARSLGVEPQPRPRRSWFALPRGRPATLRLVAVAMLLLAITGAGVALRVEFGEQQPSSRWVASLSGSEQAPEAEGAIVYRDGTASLLVSGLPPLPSDQVYEFWFVDADRNWVSAGTFQVDDQGGARVPVEVPAEWRSFTWICVTEPPASEGASRSDRIVLRGELIA